MSIFDAVLPWVGFGVTLYLLIQIQKWIHRHVFGVGYLLTGRRGPATLLFYLALAPGVVLHEISRYLVAGMFRIRPTHFTMIPQEQEDGTFELGFVHYGLVLNPIYRAILDLVPLGLGLSAVVVIGWGGLGWTTVIDSLRTGDIYIITESFQRLVQQPDFWLWSYVLFGIANTMLPSPKEARALWLPVSILVAIVVLFALLGMDLAIMRLLLGPVATALYGLTAILGTVLFIDLIAIGVVMLVERGAMTVTRREIQYAPVPKIAKTVTLPTLRNVADLALPLPPPPGKPGFRPRVVKPPSITLPIPTAGNSPAGELQYGPTDDDQALDQPIIEKPATPRLEPARSAGAPALGAGGASSGNPLNSPARTSREQSTASAPPLTPPLPQRPATGTPPQGSSANLPALRPSVAPAPKPAESVPAARPSLFGAPKPAAPNQGQPSDIIEGEIVDEDLTYEPSDE